MQNKRIMICVGIVALIVALTGCASVKVSRLSADEDIDLSGNWNDTDIRIVTEALVEDSLKANWIGEFRSRHLFRNPVVVVGTIINRSSEHIDTSIIAKQIEMAFVNTGKVDLVADIALREQVREERLSQQMYASEETAAALGKEIGADYLLQGAVRTVVDQIEGKMVRTYYVSAELIDIETSKKVWVGEETIKKLIKQRKYTL